MLATEIMALSLWKMSKSMILGPGLADSQLSPGSKARMHLQPAMTTSEWQIQGWTPVRRDDGVAHWGVVGTYVSGRSCFNVDLLKKFACGRPNANLELLMDGLIFPVGRRLNKHWAWNTMDVICSFCMCMLYKWYLVYFPNSISIFIDP